MLAQSMLLSTIRHKIQRYCQPEAVCHWQSIEEFFWLNEEMCWKQHYDKHKHTNASTYKKQILEVTARLQ